MDHLRAHGFTVKAEHPGDLRPIRTKLGVPADLEGCHVAVVDGYAVEGHVPADLIVRVLRERPRVAGLAVPGMPPGSPGMEAPGAPRTPYRVFTFERNGARQVLATR